MRRACKYDWFLSWRGLLLRLPCFQPYGSWLFVLMKSPSRSFKFPATPLNGLCDNLPSCLQLLFNLDPSNPLCPLTVTPPKQFSQWIQLFQPAPKSVKLCVLFSEQSTDSQSRLPSQQSSLPCQQSWQSTQPTLYFFRNLLVWSLKLCSLTPSYAHVIRLYAVRGLYWEYRLLRTWPRADIPLLHCLGTSVWNSQRRSSERNIGENR